jgi:hypothetical protein
MNMVRSAKQTQVTQSRTAVSLRPETSRTGANPSVNKHNDANGNTDQTVSVNDNVVSTLSTCMYFLIAPLGCSHANYSTASGQGGLGGVPPWNASRRTAGPSLRITTLTPPS